MHTDEFRVLLPPGEWEVVQPYADDVTRQWSGDLVAYGQGEKVTVRYPRGYDCPGVGGLQCSIEAHGLQVCSVADTHEQAVSLAREFYAGTVMGWRPSDSSANADGLADWLPDAESMRRVQRWRPAEVAGDIASALELLPGDWQEVHSWDREVYRHVCTLCDEQGRRVQVVRQRHTERYLAGLWGVCSVHAAGEGETITGAVTQALGRYAGQVGLLAAAYTDESQRLAGETP